MHSASSELNHGWAPLGQMALKEYGDMQQDALMANVKANKWQDVRSSPTFKHLLGFAMDHLRLLYAVDCMPNGRYSPSLRNVLCGCRYARRGP